MKTNSLSFGGRLKEQIKAKGYTRQQFADSIGVSTVTVQLWTSDKKKPTTEHLFRICEALNCDLDFLVGRIQERTHDKQFIRDYTGLDDAAIESLSRLKSLVTQYDIDIPKLLSILLSNSGFLSFLVLLYNLRLYTNSLRDDNTLDTWLRIASAPSDSVETDLAVRETAKALDQIGNQKNLIDREFRKLSSAFSYDAKTKKDFYDLIEETRFSLLKKGTTSKHKTG